MFLDPESGPCIEHSSAGIFKLQESLIIMFCSNLLNIPSQYHDTKQFKSHIIKHFIWPFMLVFPPSQRMHLKGFLIRFLTLLEKTARCLAPSSTNGLLMSDASRLVRVALIGFGHVHRQVARQILDARGIVSSVEVRVLGIATKSHGIVAKLEGCLGLAWKMFFCFLIIFVSKPLSFDAKGLSDCIFLRVTI